MKYRRIEATFIRSSVTGNPFRWSVDLTEPDGSTIFEWIQRLDRIKSQQLIESDAYYLSYFVLMDPQPEDHAKNQTRHPQP